MTFKEQLIEDFIPKIKRVIKNEEKHLDNLLRKRQGMTHWHPYYDEITKFLNDSNQSLNHLKTRLKEYIEYSEKIN